MAVRPVLARCVDEADTGRWNPICPATRGGHSPPPRQAVVWPLVLRTGLTTKGLALSGAGAVFIIGGVAPLLRQADLLTSYLLVASGWATIC